MPTAPVNFIRGRKKREAVEPGQPRLPKPEWLKVRAPGSENYHRLKGLMRSLGLHTVCEEANCPNIGECWHHGTATFMILGDTCTRSCGYCNVTHGAPKPADADDASATLAALSGRSHRVLTAVAVWDGRRTAFALSDSHVRFAGLPAEIIEAYVASGEPFGKAGSYAIQSSLAGWIERLAGSYSGIMGLPLYETTQLLRRARVQC